MIEKKKKMELGTSLGDGRIFWLEPSQGLLKFWNPFWGQKPAVMAAKREGEFGLQTLTHP